MNILITGGASGLGEAITRLLAKDNQNKIFFTYSKSIESAKKIEFDYINTKSIKCDFTKQEELKYLIEKINDLNIDVLINNAFSGDFLKTYFHKIPKYDFTKDFKENILPTIEITQSILTKFRKKKYGKIITILSSTLINVPPIGSSVYIANKAYLASLVKIWSIENAKFNITSNSVSPAFMKTNLTSKIDQRLIDQIIDSHPYKRLLTCEEVAESIYFLVNASSQINGIDLTINAGINIK
jgi:3-oxoacyl-[acyl-carrier protein] reductase